MQETETQPHHLAYKLRDFLIPSRFFAVTIPIIVLVIFVLLGVIISYTKTQDPGDTLTFIQEEAYFALSDFFDLDRVISGAASYAVWLILGAVAYLIGWAVVTAAIDRYNDIIVSKYYIHPQSFNKSNGIMARLTRTIFRASSLLALICFVFVTLRFLVPYSVSSFVFDPASPLGSFSIVNIIVACMLSFLIPYLLLLFAKLFFMKSKLFLR